MCNALAEEREKLAVVTGANGFVGSALCRELSKRDFEVFAVVRVGAAAGELERLEGVRVLSCDLDSYGRLQEVLPSCKGGVMYHLAWAGASGPARADVGVQLANVEASCSAVRAAARLGCSRFLFAASVMEYEVSEVIESGGVPAPSSAYSSAKLAADYMTRAVAGEEGVGHVRAILSNVYGVGERSQRLVCSTVNKLLRGERCSFTLGTQEYDFIYVDDAARAIADAGEKGSPEGVYYIGSGEPRPLREFLEELGDVVAPGAELGFGEVPFRGPSLDYGRFDLGALGRDTGFAPEISFRQGVGIMADWMREQM